MSNALGYRVVGHGGQAQFDEYRRRENARINSEVIPERNWWGGKLISDEQSGLATGQLIELPIDDRHYRMVGLLRSGKEPRTLRKQAYSLLRAVQARWYLTSDHLTSPDTILLSVTSLYRSAELQKELQASTSLASNGISAHCAGAAFDFDPQGYYLKGSNKSVIADDQAFDPRYTLNLRAVLEKLAQEGFCHLIVEKGYRLYGQKVTEHDACFHVCVSPGFMKP